MFSSASSLVRVWVVEGSSGNLRNEWEVTAGERCRWLELECWAWMERVAGDLGVSSEALLIGCSEGLSVVFK